MSYEFKKTESVINGIKYSVVLSEYELTYQVAIREDDITVEKFIQGKSKDTCMWHRNCGKDFGMLCMGEMMNTAHNLYEQFSERLLASN